MEKEFIYEAQFRKWVEKKKGDASTFISTNRNYLKNSESEYKKNFFFYVPSLIVSKHRDLAMKLLACAYIDILLKDYKHVSFFKEYCRFAAQIQFIDVRPLAFEEIELIKDCLNKREVWICEHKFACTLDNKLKGKSFRQRFDIRIRSWKRDYFPLDSIKKIIDIASWVASTYKSIIVVTSDNSIKLQDVAAFEFQKKDNNTYYVYAITNKGEKVQVYTPTAENKNRKMSVRELDDMSIDHVVPLYTVIKTLQNEKTQYAEVLRNLTDAKEMEADISELIDYKKVLKRFMEDLLKGTSYQLMERGENSKKSNFTPYIRYEKNGEKYKFIVAEHIEAKDICDKNKYRVYYTSESNKLILEIER